jgi:hypothetical protein
MIKRLLPENPNSPALGLGIVADMIGVKSETLKEWVENQRVKPTAIVGIRKLRKWSLTDVAALRARIYQPQNNG